MGLFRFWAICAPFCAPLRQLLAKCQHAPRRPHYRRQPPTKRDVWPLRQTRIAEKREPSVGIPIDATAPHLLYWRGKSLLLTAPGSPNLQGYAAQRWFKPVRSASVIAHGRRTHSAMDAFLILRRQPGVHLSRRPPAVPLPARVVFTPCADSHPMPVSVGSTHRDGRETHLPSPCPTRHTALPPNDNPADNSRFATPPHPPLAPTLRCSEHLSDPQAGRWCDCRAAPAQPRVPASSAGAASPAAAFGQFRRPDRWVHARARGRTEPSVPR